MMKTTLATALMMLTAAPLLAQTQAAVDPAIYPKAKAGMTRHILEIPAVELEGNHKIEIVAGLNMMKDCNNIMIAADIEEETLEGWGYTYHVIDDVSQPASTMMGCPPDAKPVETFITLNLGEDAMVRYNSKLPVVVYAPENLTVGYRVWSTDGKLQGVAK